MEDSYPEKQKKQKSHFSEIKHNQAIEPPVVRPSKNVLAATLENTQETRERLYRYPGGAGGDFGYFRASEAVLAYAREGG
jgi:hypothetical protein